MPRKKKPRDTQFSQKVIDYVCRNWGISPDDIGGSGMSAHLAEARALAGFVIGCNESHRAAGEALGRACGTPFNHRNFSNWSARVWGNRGLFITAEALSVRIYGRSLPKPPGSEGKD